MVTIRHEFKCNVPRSSFTKTERGEFCGACQKEVIDFTEKTNEEILQIITAHGGTVCGSMFVGQLEENRSAFGVRRKVAIAGLAALLGLAPGQLRAGDAVKTEIVSETAHESSFSVAADTTECSTEQPVIETPEKPVKKKKQIKRKTLFYIGSLRIYTMNVFPFIGARRNVTGVYAKW